MAKPENFLEIQSHLNSFDKNLQFTIDRFSDQEVNFLDISIKNTRTDLFYKPTHTGQYCHFASQTPWKLKTAWVKALYHRAFKICSTSELLTKQLNKIKLFMSWNGYPSSIAKSILKRLQATPPEVNRHEKDDLIKIFFRVPFSGEKGEQLVNKCINKVHRFTKKNVVFVRLFNTKKVSMFCPTKDKIPTLQKANVIYKIKCPACGEEYVG